MAGKGAQHLRRRRERKQGQRWLKGSEVREEKEKHFHVSRRNLSDNPGTWTQLQSPKKMQTQEQNPPGFRKQ